MKTKNYSCILRKMFHESKFDRKMSVGRNSTMAGSDLCFGKTGKIIAFYREFNLKPLKPPAAINHYLNPTCVKRFMANNILKCNNFFNNGSTARSIYCTSL